MNPSRGSPRRPVLGAALTLLLLLAGSSGPAAAADAEGLAGLSLEELMEIEVTSVSKRGERLQAAPAAIFVVTADDIRRSGATSLPDVLRMVPGVHVGRIDSNKWSVGVRGFSGRFANKLLVLIDGRSIYTPLFSGVFWDVQDTILEDVERIEVIRGPGGTLWGANAVNGVINIITKNAADTQGGLLSATAGTLDRLLSTVRYGGRAGDDGYYRAYAKYLNRDSTLLAATGQHGDDEWDLGRAGARFDWKLGSRDSIRAQAELYDGEIGSTLNSFSRDTLSLAPRPVADDVSGGHGILSWSRDLGEDSGLILSGYYARSERSGEDTLFGEIRDTLDLEFQHRVRLGARNDFLWGVGYRYTTDRIEGSDTIFFADPERSDPLYSAFVQDTIRLTERLRLTLGSKFEHNNYTGNEFQPGLRLLWAPSVDSSFWFSVARAVRIPSRAEHDGRVEGLFGVVGPGEPPNPLPLPVVSSLPPNPDLISEELLAYEAGYRAVVHPRVSLDIAVFYNDYDNLRAFGAGALTCEPSGDPVAVNPLCFISADYLSFPVPLSNAAEGRVYGGEVVVDWQPVSRWRLQGVYSHNTTDFAGPGDVPVDLTYEGFSPRNVFSLRSQLDAGRSWEVDLWLRYSDAITNFEIPSYWTLDARLAWRLSDELSIGLIGQNLLEPEHREYESELLDIVPAAIQRSGSIRVIWKF